MIVTTGNNGNTSTKRRLREINAKWLKMIGYLGFMLINSSPGRPIYKIYTTRLPENSHFCAVYNNTSKENFYNSYILPHMDYCSTLWDNAITSDRIYKLQRRAARIRTNSEYRAPSDPLLEQLNWLPLLERVKYRQSQLVYKAVNGLAPDYMCALFTLISNMSLTHEPMFSRTPLL